MIKVGDKLTDGSGSGVEITAFDSDRKCYIGWHEVSCGYLPYRENGECIARHERFHLIIPPQLPFQWVVGDWYKCSDGTVAMLRNTDDQELAWLDSDSGTICVWSACGKVCSSEKHPSDIIAHLGPLPQGVYHVSDGDTQLLRDLKRWQERGGKVEAKSSIHNWKHFTGTTALFSVPGNLYRARGCTDDREFPLPPLQMREGRCRTRDGRECRAKLRHGCYGENCWTIECGIWRWTADNSGRAIERCDDIVELLDDPQPEQKLDLMKRPMTFADLDRIFEMAGYPLCSNHRKSVRQLAESQP